MFKASNNTVQNHSTQAQRDTSNVLRVSNIPIDTSLRSLFEAFELKNNLLYVKYLSTQTFEKRSSYTADFFFRDSGSASHLLGMKKLHNINGAQLRVAPKVTLALSYVFPQKNREKEVTFTNLPQGFFKDQISSEFSEFGEIITILVDPSDATKVTVTFLKIE